MITVIGSLNYDLVTTADRIPDGGETVAANSFATYCGGKGANEALALSRLSHSSQRVAMVGLVGTDSFGDQLLQHLSAEEVDVSNVRRAHVGTGIATILVDKDGQNRILVYPGANADLTPDRIVPTLWRGSRFILLQNEIPIESNLKVLELAHAQGVKTVYNPSPVKAIPADYWKRVDYLIVNTREAADIVGHPAAEAMSMVVKLEAQGASWDERLKLADDLLKMGVGTAVVTLGPAGCVFASNAERGYCPAAQAHVVDTTGAGDTFLAAFVSERAIGLSISDSVKFATKAAAIAVSHKGAASSVPFLHEVLNYSDESIKS